MKINRTIIICVSLTVLAGTSGQAATSERNGNPRNQQGVTVAAGGAAKVHNGKDRSIVSAVNPAPFVIPGLQQWEGGSGWFHISRRTAIVLDPVNADSLEASARILSDDLAKLHAGKFSIKVGKPSKGDILLSLRSPDTSLGQEGYVLEARNGSLRIAAPHARGLFWGTRTLLQVLEQDSLHERFPCGTARDFPRYAIRGFVLDDGRKFFSLDFLRQYVKFMAYYKMNEFHLHLNDNGFHRRTDTHWDSTYAAFRLQCDTYPDLTAKDGSYTKEEFRQLETLAHSYGVNIVPEIDAPAHARAFTRMRPEIGSKLYGMDHLDLDNPVTYRVMDSIFAEYLGGPDPVFSGPDVHIGTDEYAKPAAEQFRAYTDHYIRLVQGYGKNVRLWGALTHAKGKTPVTVKGVTMNVWYNGYADPREMERLGYDIISTPDGWLYIVPAAGYYNDYLDLPELYNKWEPVQVGDVRFPEGDPKIKGGSFAVWNDKVGNGITAQDVHDRVFPAMQVLSQKMWKGADTTLAFADFALHAKNVGEGPGSNIRGRVPGARAHVLQSHGKRVNARLKNGSLMLKGGCSYLKTPLTEIGYDYTVSFSIRPDPGNGPNTILFSSPHAVVKLKQQGTGNLGFSREGYDFCFDYAVPAGVWTRISISGNHRGTSLFVNDSLVERLEGKRLAVPGSKDSLRLVQTLFFPLEFVGDSVGSFKGSIRDLEILPGDR